MLTYFSVNNISNLKELTEKKILEEQRGLSVRYLDAIKNNIENLANKFSDELNTHGLLIDSLLKAVSRYDCIDQLFILNKDGTFIFPNFPRLQKNISEASFSDSFKTTFEAGEKAEFVENKLKTARQNYLSSLQLSTEKADSAKAINALGRIYLKLNDFKNARACYQQIVFNYYSELSPDGFPYVYYAIQQLIKISNTATIDEMASMIESALGKMETGAISLNFITEKLLIQIGRWTNNNSFHQQGQLAHINKMIDKINLQLNFISEYETELPELLNIEATGRYLSVGNRYRAINAFSGGSGELILINTNFEKTVGFVVDREKLLAEILGTDIQSGFDFEYLSVLSPGNMNSTEYYLKYSSELLPFFPGLHIQIMVKDENLIKEFITRRSWVYGIASILILVAMLLGIILILRDISREKQIARLRSDFISNVTHELKTPLTSIHMFAESLLLGRVKSVSDKNEYLSIIINESARLKRMINNILEFSKMERVKPEYHFVESNISLILKTTIQEMAYWLEEEKFEVVTELDENISAKIAPEEIKQAFGNLLNNAIKYSTINKKIIIRLFKKANQISIEVEDQGIGIPEDQFDLIFNKFYRVDRKEGISGTGLGLTVIKGIVDAHNGEILVTSTVGKGSKFSILLNK